MKMNTEQPAPGSQNSTEREEGHAKVDPPALNVDQALAEEGEDVGVQLGGALTSEQAREVTASSRTTVIVLAGGVRSGKTTLLTTIYEHFLQEPLAGYLFAGSRTLTGFERRCHPGRIESGLFVPRMKRTNKLEPPWLHLRVREASLRLPALDLLFADLSGEWFDELVLGKTTPGELPHVFRADHLSLVLDGRKLSRPGDRDEERQKIEQLARLLIETNSLASPQALSIVVTKWDEVARVGPSAQDYADSAVLRVASSAGFATAPPYWRTAARPRTTDFSIGHGIAALFGFWVSNPQLSIEHDFPLVRFTDPFFTFRATRPWPAGRR